jgi:hypothetical protein
MSITCFSFLRTGRWLRSGSTMAASVVRGHRAVRRRLGRSPEIACGAGLTWAHLGYDGARRQEHKSMWLHRFSIFRLAPG